MKKERTYWAEYDNGHEYGSFYYTSCHRNKSKANRDDAKSEMIRKYGRHAANYRITRTFRSDDEC